MSGRLTRIRAGRGQHAEVLAERLVVVVAPFVLLELRDLVRGTAPSILIDRGLVAAIASIAGQGSVQTFVDSSRVGNVRFSPAVERAGYFVATEALTNVAKHSHATRADVIFWRDTTRLFVEIWDDGRGGATVEPGGGLAGMSTADIDLWELNEAFASQCVYSRDKLGIEPVSCCKVSGQPFRISELTDRIEAERNGDAA